MNMAIEMSKMSRCKSKQVAALMVIDGRIISTGVNGTPAGFINCDDIFAKELDELSAPIHRAWSDKYELHAEQNAIVRAAKDGIAIAGAVVYCTLKPCDQCVKLLIAAGISEIYYKHKYDRYNNSENSAADVYLEENGVKICQLV